MGPCPEEFGVQSTGDYLVSRNRHRSQPDATTLEGVGAEGENEADEEDEAQATSEVEGFTDDVYPGARNGAVMFDRGSDFVWFIQLHAEQQAKQKRHFENGRGQQKLARAFSRFIATAPQNLSVQRRTLNGIAQPQRPATLSITGWPSEWSDAPRFT